VTLWIEGEDEPAHDFAESTKQAVKEIIEAGAPKHPELKVTVKNLGERGVDDSPKPKAPPPQAGTDPPAKPDGKG
jgi:hypothetical protein